MPLVLLFLLIGLAATLSWWPMPRRWRGWGRWVFWLASGGVLAGAAWHIALPQGVSDFDTCYLLSRVHLGRAEGLHNPTRPLQAIIQYPLLRVAQGAGVGLDRALVVQYVAAFLAAFGAMVAGRRRLFATAAPAPPVLATAAFLTTAAGEFLLDSWNDHTPLVFFYVAGLAAVLGLRGPHPRAAGWLAAGLFLAESLLHPAEPYLWLFGAVGLVVALRPRRGESPWRLPPLPFWIAAGGALVAAGVVVAQYPGGLPWAWHYLKTRNPRRYDVELLRQFAAGNDVGGIAPLLARYLWPVLALGVGALALVALARHRDPRARVGAALAVPAVAYPLLYETTNPERYWPLAILWTLVGAQSLGRLRALMRLRRRGGRVGLALFAATFGLAGGFVVVTGLAAPRLVRNSVILETYLAEMPRLNAALDPGGTLIVAESGSFYLYQETWLAARIRRWEKDQPAGAILAELAPTPTGKPVYLNAGAARRLAAEAPTSPTLRRVYGRPRDPATPVYRWMP